MGIKNLETARRLRELGDMPIRRLAPAAAAVAVFSLGAISGVTCTQLGDKQATSPAQSAANADADADRESESLFVARGIQARQIHEKRDLAVTNLRAARTQTSKSLSAACRDPHALTEAVSGGTTAAMAALYDVEHYNAALHEYGNAADQFPAMTYHSAGIYTRDGARLAYFTDGSGRVQRDPTIDAKASLYELDWCRSLHDFNAS
ncbi:hypothetical protein [Mycobacteroides abscessus]|uniref:hypothetical protein n=1 Tax=Mycobacteroides abscessus TaxID=36809 RepID=UPI0005E456D1|nr:hypothetical protein [Mycobacteroides abscessus]CPW52946.1 Uncharacterised protein [Mycobacteroides abscessus]SKF44165.1 Uncharacterised protein [Mycobacteroides abscessus subsp. bolletii]SKH16473.1 Uncharacterised protein [Mycobacteroides abscessus subsp. bolletii]